MTAIKKMYQVLEQMIESADREDKERVLTLNKLYEGLIPRVYHKPLTPLDLEYDNCRQSCVMSLQMRNMRERLLSDAKERFSRIPKPNR